MSLEWSTKRYLNFLLLPGSHHLPTGSATGIQLLLRHRSLFLLRATRTAVLCLEHCSPRIYMASALIPFEPQLQCHLLERHFLALPPPSKRVLHTPDCSLSEKRVTNIAREKTRMNSVVIDWNQR